MPNTVDYNRYATTIVIGAPLIKRVLWYLTSCFVFESNLFPNSSIKVYLLRMFGAKIGNGARIKPNVKIKFPWKLELGDNIWIGEYVWIDNHDYVRMGNNVCISQGAMLLCGNHDYSKVTFNFFSRQIIIDSGAWIGAKAIVCPGVVVNSHAVLTVGSVATSHLEAYSIYQGNPAVRIKDRIIE